MAAAQIDLERYERLDPAVAVPFNGERIIYLTPNLKTKWRVDTLFTKEPATLEWIAGFARDEVLIDIGANVGMYTIWAARTRGVKVYAFEPEAQNFALLNRNIAANRLNERVRAFCLGLTDETGYGELYLSGPKVGSSCHAVSEPLNWKLEPFETPLVQGCAFTSLDELVARGAVPVPHHIKIDVDGFEHKVIDGAQDTLRNPTVRSLLVEINTNLEQHRRILDRLAEHGFSYAQEQVDAAIVRDGAFQGVAEHIFRR